MTETITYHRVKETRGLPGVVAAVAAYFGMKPDEMLSPRRHASIAHARKVGMWAARRLTGASYPDIATAFRKADHGTAMFACTSVDQRRAIDKKFKRDTDELLAKIGPQPSLQ